MKKFLSTLAVAFSLVLSFSFGYGRAVGDVYRGCLRAQGPKDCKDLGFMFNDSPLAHWWSP
jgi:hypothetical protein